MKKVLGIGNALVDILIKIDDDQLLETLKLPKGSMQLVDQAFASKVLEMTAEAPKEVASGGSAANTIHGLAHLGVPTGYVGKIGVDEYGDIFRSDMLDKSISPHLFTGNQATGRAHAIISKDGERTFATYLGAAVELADRDLDQIPFEDYQLLHIEGYLVQNQNLIKKGMKLAKDHGLKVSIDMASYNVVEAHKTFLYTLIKDYVDIVFANEEESKVLTGLEPADAVRKIAEIADIAVVKVGARGALIQDQSNFYAIEAIEATPLDTTGAGDLYAAGFLYGMVHNYPIEKSGKIGALLGGKVIETLGAHLTPDAWRKIKDALSQ